MTKLDIIGLGIWSPFFANWEDFRHGVETGHWRSDVELQPRLMPSRERRRAPQFVKMAVEVMNQACDMATAEPNDVATVFSSVMGDMEITDYLCRELSNTPKFVSPTKFHNAVHNAAPGYWSITTDAFSAGNAISAFEYTPTMALLEACIQAAEEDQPVLLVTQELTAPQPLMIACPSEQPFSAGLLIAPPGRSNKPLYSLEFIIETTQCQWPSLSKDLDQFLGTNMSARLLPLLSKLVSLTNNSEPAAIQFPVSANSSLCLTLASAIQSS